MLKHKYLILLILWLVFISTLSLIELNVERVPKVDETDKVVHFLFHYILSVFLMFYLRYENVLFEIKGMYYFVLLFSTFYGLLIEGLQATISTNRDPDFFDVLANILGCLVSLLSFSYFLRLKRE